MDSRKIALLGLVGLLAGCSSDPSYTFEPRDATCADPSQIPCETTVTPGVDARTHTTPQTMPDTTFTYIISTVHLPKPAEGPTRLMAPGFNVDGLDSQDGSTDASANCEQFQPDYVSTTDPAHVGVDNALSGLVPTIEGLVGMDNCPGGVVDGCVDNLLQEQIEAGSLLLLAEVSGVNDFNYDSSINLQLMLGALPEGAELQLGADGAILPGQTFATMMTLGNGVTGDIFAGRVRASAPLITFNIATMDFTIPLMITEAEVRFNISENGLSNGAIGGVITVEAIVSAASMIMDGIETTVRQVVEGIADVDPDPAQPEVCQALSVGIEFSAVSATRTP